MHHLFKYILVSALLLLVIGGAEAETCNIRIGDPKDVDFQYYVRWKRLYNESERLEKTEDGIRYTQPMLDAHNSFFIKLMNKCQAEARKSGQTMFMAIAIVAKNGVVEEYLTYPRKTEYQCYVDGVIGQKYPPPPTDQYPVGFLVMFDNPIGTPDEACVRKVYGKQIDKIWSKPNPSFEHGAPSVAH